MGLDAAGLLEELVTEDQGQIDGDTKVTGDEGLVLLLAEVASSKDVVVLGESDDDAHDQGKV